MGSKHRLLPKRLLCRPWLYVYSAGPPSPLSPPLHACLLLACLLACSGPVPPPRVVQGKRPLARIHKPAPCAPNRDHQAEGLKGTRSLFASLCLLRWDAGAVVREAEREREAVIPGSEYAWQQSRERRLSKARAPAARRLKEGAPAWPRSAAHFPLCDGWLWLKRRPLPLSSLRFPGQASHNGRSPQSILKEPFTACVITSSI